MPKVKTLLVVLLVITFAFSLLGCGLITSRTTSTDEVVEMGGQVPEWLLLSHRSIASEESDMDDDLAAIDEDDNDEERDEAVGGVDADTADSSQTEQASSEVAQAAESGSSEGTQQQQESSSQQQESSGGSTFDDLVAKIKPGTSAYNDYLQHREPGETPEEFVRRALKAKADHEEAEQQGSFMEWKPRTDFSQGFSNNDDD